MTARADWRFIRSITAQERVLDTASRLRRIGKASYAAQCEREREKQAGWSTEDTADMPTYFQFAFGVGNYFKFSFTVGRSRDPSPSKIEGRQASIEFDRAMAKKNGIQIDDPDKPITPKEQNECPLFSAIPTEIRRMIYSYVLTTPEPIQKVHKHLGSKETAMLDQYAPVPNIDAAILRTCRLIYSEALPVLYGQNIFQFDCAHNIRGFQSKNLTSFPTAFNLKLAPMGRLTMLRHIILNLDSEYPMRPRSNGARIPPDRDRIWREWTMHVFSQEKDPYFRYSGRDDIEFPSLQKLKLDFTEWQLGDDEGLLVKPFVHKLGEHGKLEELALKGVKHAGTIEAFRAGLLREGGTFHVED